MDKQKILSVAETNKLREELGLKPIPVFHEKNVGSKESLSIEETNELRATLGLKLIPSQQNINVSRNNMSSTAKADALREKIIKFQNANKLLGKPHILEEADTGEGSSWLENLNAITAVHEAKPSGTVLPHEDVELHDVQVTYNIEDLSTKKDTILTLKESSIFDDADSTDVLENEKASQETTDREKLRLRQINKDRRQKKIKLHVSSLDIEEEEKNSHANTNLIIGAEQGVIEVPKPASIKMSAGKVKVNFKDVDDNSDENSGDFKSLKIKKRKIKDPKSTKSRKLKISQRMERVKLVDEDESLSWMDEEQPVTIINPRSNLKNELKSADHLAREIEKVRDEEEQRAEDISKMRENSDNIIIDEKVSFLNTLDVNLLEGYGIENEVKLDNEEETNIGNITDQHLKEANDNHKLSEMVDNESKNEEDNKVAPNFFSGLASTLGAFRKKTIPGLEHAKSKADIDAKQSSNIELLRKRALNKKLMDPNTNINDELYKLNRSEASEGSDNATNIQPRKQDYYDPEIQLIYRDEKGNQLTTKEAYKKLSQKFHGTKSNKKKRAKMQSRIEARKNALEDDNLLEFGNN